MIKVGRHFGPNDCAFFIIFLAYTVILLSLGKYFGTTYLYQNVEKRGPTSGQCVLKTIGKPTLVVGIVTWPNENDKRQSLRQTWAFMDSDNLPFNVVYKFILDSKTVESQKERNIYKDIVHLHKENSLTPSKRLYLWFKYVNKFYPSAEFAAKIEADISLCIPEIFYRIKQLGTENMLYGYKLNLESNELKYTIHNAFMVIEKSLVERITKRSYCVDTECQPSSLQEMQNETMSLAKWLDLYGDVELQSDNKNLKLESQPTNRLINGEYTRSNLCKKYLLYNSTLNNFNSKTLNDNTISGFKESESDTTGKLFSGEIIREVPPVRVNQQDLIVRDDGAKIRCDKWAVSTTIFEASISVRNMVRLPDWCTVIVADTKTPSRERYLGGLGNNYDKNRVVFLSTDEQDHLYPHLSKLTAWKTFSRKNIGYIYAIHHGAKLIWDFDDDNDGIVDTNIIKTDGSFAFGEPCTDYKHTKINPYPYFGVKEPFPWPRGFPLQDILNVTYAPKICESTSNRRLKVGVVQSLANTQPDVDAIYRLVRQTPFNFMSTVNSRLPMRIPKNAYTPFNAQATLWTYPAFRYLVLPSSVNGRVADIWRSYFAEFFLFRKNIDVIFTPPFVDQQRNPHNYISDFNAENDLYQKSFQLVQHLSNETLTKDYNDLDDMYIDMYRRGYLGLKDLPYIRAWIKTFEALNSD